MRVGFPYISKQKWTGGYNYLLNLFRVLNQYSGHTVRPVLFAGEDVEDHDLTPFTIGSDEPIVRSSLFNKGHEMKRLIPALVLGRDRSAEKLFRNKEIHAVFEPAIFYGSRFSIPAIAWIPDLQHRHMPQMFSKMEYWKRELGVRAQISSGRMVMVGSETTKQDCERFYPKARGNTFAVPFAVCVSDVDKTRDPEKTRLSHQLPDRFYYLPNQFWKHKNHKVVIEAVKILKERGDHVVVAASGHPKDPRHPRLFDQLKTMIKSAGLEINFRMLGMIPYDEVLGLMRSSIAVINPSLCEGWSTTVEEAKSLGISLILSDIPVHREQASQSSLFFDPYLPDALANILRVKRRPLNIQNRIVQEDIANRETLDRLKKYVRGFQELVSATLKRSGKFH